jgi:hypothetical protein
VKSISKPKRENKKRYKKLKKKKNKKKEGCQCGSSGRVPA